MHENTAEYRDLFARLGWTQRQLARRLDLTDATINGRLRGKHPVKLEHLEALRRVVEQEAPE